MASRFAQNCASCHAPGRVNVPAPQRRCSLSCQGCHTNPSGGGLRNEYGKWTEERWLNSMYVRGYKLNKPRPQPTDQQYYAEKRLKAYLGSSPKNKQDEYDRKRTRIEGFRLRETLADLPESEYDRRSTGEKVFMNDQSEAQWRIPQDDPWRKRRENYFNAGLDWRYFYLDTTADGTKVPGSGKHWLPMATDVSVSVEPVHRLTFAYEARFLTDPRTISVWDEHYTTGAQVRSAYALIDDLPYNTFVQYGIYRPLFGQYNPDHTTLFAKASGLDMEARYKVMSVGTAPNVPFLNIHSIMPFESSTAPKDKGFAVNAGARFVTLGAYGTVSYWNTTAHSDTDQSDTKKTMTSLTGGFTKSGLTMVFDFTRIQKETTGPAITNPPKNAGNVITLEPRYRFFKENYLKASYEMMNTSPNLLEGKASQTGFGYSGFIISGVEIDIMLKDLKYTEQNVDHKTKQMWFQTHFFF